MFSSSNKNRMGSSAYTNIKQGGGSKKAGFPSMVGRGSWTSIALESCNPKQENYKCCDLTKINTLRFTTPVSQSLPVGFDSRIRMR
jgi:hypothetical protein